MTSRETEQADPGFFSSRRSGPDGVVVLEYHRISKATPDPHSLCVSPEHFSEHLEVLASRYTPTSLVSMAKQLREGKIEPKSVAITFDDGYADNLLNAKPRLDSRGLPATFFVTLDYVEGRREFWWDELERCLLESTSLPPTLELETGGRPYRQSLRDASSPPADKDGTYWNWDLGVKKDPTARHRAYRELHALMRSLLPAQRERMLDGLRSAAGFQDKPARDEYRPLTRGELLELDGGDLAEAGGHALTHSVLAALPLADQREEIMGCKERLEGILGRGISLFSYPFGGKRDYTGETARLVRDAGFSAACASRPGRVVSSSDPFQIPRHFVYDWDGEHFERQMERFFRR